MVSRKGAGFENIERKGVRLLAVTGVKECRVSGAWSVKGCVFALDRGREISNECGVSLVQSTSI